MNATVSRNTEKLISVRALRISKVWSFEIANLELQYVIMLVLDKWDEAWPTSLSLRSLTQKKKYCKKIKSIVPRSEDRLAQALRDENDKQ